MVQWLGLGASIPGAQAGLLVKDSSYLKVMGRKFKREKNDLRISRIKRRIKVTKGKEAGMGRCGGPGEGVAVQVKVWRPRIPGVMLATRK